MQTVEQRAELVRAALDLTWQYVEDGQFYEACDRARTLPYLIESVRKAAADEARKEGSHHE